MINHLLIFVRILKRSINCAFKEKLKKVYIYKWYFNEWKPRKTGTPVYVGDLPESVMAWYAPDAKAEFPLPWHHHVSEIQSTYFSFTYYIFASSHLWWGLHQHHPSTCAFAHSLCKLINHRIEGPSFAYSSLSSSIRFMISWTSAVPRWLLSPYFWQSNLQVLRACSHH